MPRLLGCRAGGKGVSADSRRLRLPRLRERAGGHAASRSEAAQKVFLSNEIGEKLKGS